MALISPQQTTHLEIPHEPGAWVDLRPLTARDIADLQREGKDKTQGEVTLLILARNLARWSYPEPVCVETLERLDFETFNWLDQQLLTASSLRGEAEKKDSAQPSSPTTEPAPAASPQSWVT